MAANRLGRVHAWLTVSLFLSGTCPRPSLFRCAGFFLRASRSALAVITGHSGEFELPG